MTAYDRLNRLTIESTQTAFDAALLAQRQTAQLVQAWLGTIESNQQTARDLTVRAVQQAQEAQTLYADLAQETVRAGVDAFATLAQSQLHEAGEQIDKASRQTKANGKTAEAAAK